MWRNCLSRTCKEVLAKNCELAAKSRKPVLLADLGNRPDSRYSLTDNVPRFLTSGHPVYLIKSNDNRQELPRPLIAKELYAVMGWPVYTHPESCVIQHALPHLTDTKLRALIGNSMHLAPLVQLLFWFLACTERVEPEHL